MPPQQPSAQQQITQLQQQVADLQQQIGQINFDTQIIGMVDVVSAIPSSPPRTIFDQIKIYTNGTTYRLYWYDWKNQHWRYATGT